MERLGPDGASGATSFRRVQIRPIPAGGDNLGAVNVLLGRSWRLGVNGLTSGQHFDELVDPPGAGFRFLGVSEPVEDGVPIRTGEHFKHRVRAGTDTQSGEKILRHFDAGLPGVGGLPSTVLSCLSHLVFAGSMHPTGGDQPFCDGSVPLRPRAARFSRRETSSERTGVTTPQLTINPAEADRFVKRLVVRDGRRIGHSFLGQYQPDSQGIGVMGAQPSSPFASVHDQ